MKYAIPEASSALRRTVAKRHNFYVMILLLVVGAILILGVLALRRSPLVGYAVLGVAIAVEIAGTVLMMRLDKRLSVALGFICPICHGALYDGRSNRLASRGECPCCRQFVVERLK
jgi:4-amino-4-deoxy-L-arabinose transferase-like glycosyltransferase